MGTSTWASVRIPEGANPRSAAVIEQAFFDNFRCRFSDRSQGKAINGFYEFGAESIYWGAYEDFPDWARTALLDNETDEGDPDPLPLASFIWHQAGDGETGDWLYECTPNENGTDFVCVMKDCTADGDPYLTGRQIEVAIADTTGRDDLIAALRREL